jgi:hypothetical protein
MRAASVSEGCCCEAGRGCLETSSSSSSRRRRQETLERTASEQLFWRQGCPLKPAKAAPRVGPRARFGNAPLDERQALLLGPDLVEQAAFLGPLALGEQRHLLDDLGPDLTLDRRLDRRLAADVFLRLEPEARRQGSATSAFKRRLPPSRHVLCKHDASWSWGCWGSERRGGGRRASSRFRAGRRGKGRLRARACRPRALRRLAGVELRAPNLHLPYRLLHPPKLQPWDVLPRRSVSCSRCVPSFARRDGVSVPRRRLESLTQRRPVLLALALPPTF